MHRTTAVSLCMLCLCLPAGAQIVAGYPAVAAFDGIPSDAIQDAAALRLMVRHASIGFTITNALDCIQGTRTSPAQCTTFQDYYYDRRNWTFFARGNSGWYGKLVDFAAAVDSALDSFDVFTFKYCYLDGLDGLAVPCGGTFSAATVTQAWDSLRTTMERLEQAHPTKTFIWWTIPLTQQVGMRCTDTLNAIIRAYTLSHSKVLFDLADIENHDSTGVPLTGTSGYSVAYRPNCGEQQPDAQSCHPNWDGSIMIGKALWWLMARIAGWDGSSGVSRLPRALRTITASSLRHAGESY